MLLNNNFKKKILLIFPLFFLLTACPKTNKETGDKPNEISSEPNNENLEDSDEEYDSSAVYSQDSDGGAH